MSVPSEFHILTYVSASSSVNVNIGVGIKLNSEFLLFVLLFCLFAFSLFCFGRLSCLVLCFVFCLAQLEFIWLKHYTLDSYNRYVCWALDLVRV